MWWHFVGLQVHFALNLGAALACLAVAWLVFDAFLGRRAVATALKSAGFAVLSVGFMLAAISPDATVSPVWLAALEHTLKLIGLVAIGAAELLVPLQALPPAKSRRGLRAILHRVKGRNHAVAGTPVTATLVSLVPLAAAGVALLYWRRAYQGLERHLMPVAWAFLWIAVSEALSALGDQVTSANPLIEQILAPYGPVWIGALAFLGLGTITLGHWVWNYLTKRLATQLFMTLAVQAIALCLVATVGVSALLMQNIRAASLSDITTAARVLGYAVDSARSELGAQAKAVAARPGLAAALAGRSHEGSGQALQDGLSEFQISTLMATDASGVALWRGEDPQRWGDARSNDVLVRRALVGTSIADVVPTSGGLNAGLRLVAAAPVRDASGTITGTIVIGRNVSDAFLDTIKSSTGLDSSAYAGRTRAATTIAGTSGRRATGVRETNDALATAVLANNQRYSGTSTEAGRDILVAAVPLGTQLGRPVGMLQASRPASELIAAAGQSSRVIFAAAILTLLLAAWPLLILSRYLEKQLR